MLIDKLIEYRIQTVLLLQIEKQKKKMLAALLHGTNQWFLMAGITDEERTMFSRIKDMELMEEEHYELDRDLETELEVMTVQEQLNSAISDLNLLRIIKDMSDMYDVEEENEEVDVISIPPELYEMKSAKTEERVSEWIAEIRKSLKEIIDDVERSHRSDREFQFRKALDYDSKILDPQELNPCVDGKQRGKWEEERSEAGHRLKQYQLFNILFS